MISLFGTLFDRRAGRTDGSVVIVVSPLHALMKDQIEALMRLSLLRETPPPPPPPPPWGIRRDLTFIKANCPWLGVNNWSIVYTTWSDKRSNACPTTVKCVANYDIHASNPHLIPTSPQGRGVSRNNDRCITRRDATAVCAGDANSDALLLDMSHAG